MTLTSRGLVRKTSSEPRSRMSDRATPTSGVGAGVGPGAKHQVLLTFILPKDIQAVTEVTAGQTLQHGHRSLARQCRPTSDPRWSGLAGVPLRRLMPTSQHTSLEAGSPVSGLCSCLSQCP